ncbi:hypothetical protein J7655_11445 [Pseudomonas wenzhouensis]|nr:hypothetical protein [Pseudomonas wenzhouensis]UFQ99668.1 hypothetical protein J7655_11445 [Pseudomonas wenzhouensis]
MIVTGLLALLDMQQSASLACLKVGAANQAETALEAMGETAASSIQLAELGRELQGMAGQFHLV